MRVLFQPFILIVTNKSIVQLAQKSNGVNGSGMVFIGHPEIILLIASYPSKLDGSTGNGQ